MRDTALFTALRTVLLAGLALSDAPTTEVKRASQATQIGADTGPTVYFQKMMDRDLGSPQRKHIWDDETSDYVNAQIQKVATSFQIMGIHRLAVTDEGMTASDLANEARAILQSDDAIAAFLAVDVGVERVTQVRNSVFTDGQDQYEFSPSFDFVLTHDQVTFSRTPGAVAFEVDIKRV